MRRTAFLVPLKGLLVRDPDSFDILPATGEVKPLVGREGRYWRRRIKDGSVKINSPFNATRAKRKTEGGK